MASLLKTTPDRRSNVERGRILAVSVGALSLAATVFVATALWFLYRSELNREKEHLMEAVAETVGLLAARSPTTPADGVSGHAHQLGHDWLEMISRPNVAGAVIAEIKETSVAYVRHQDTTGGRTGNRVTLPIVAEAAEPFRRAHAGEAGVVLTVDRFGRQVLAAFAPSADRGVVVAAFTPLRDILVSYIRSAVWIVLIAVVFVLAAAFDLRYRIMSFFRQMKEREAEVRSTVNNIRDVFFIVDKDWRITFANKRAEELFHRTFDEMAGKPIWDEAPELDSAFYHRLCKALHTQQFDSFEGLYQPANKWFEMRAYPNEDGLAISMIDVTELRLQKDRLQEAEARFRDLVEGSIQGISIHQDKTIVYANEAYARLHGYAVEEIIGMSVLDLIWPDDLDLFHSHNKARASGERETDRYLLRALTKDGSPRWIEAQARLIRRDGRPATQATIIDVSERKAAEEALYRQSELAQLSRNIAVSVNEAESVSEALQTTLEQICASMKWPVGHAYLVDADGGQPARSAGVWFISDTARYSGFRRACESISLAPGEGTPGRVVRDGQPCCNVEIGRVETGQGSRIAVEAGLHARCAYPILDGDDVVGVLEFFHDRAVRSDDEFTRNMSVVGSQLGRFIERDRAKWALEDSERRFKDFAEVSSDWFWELGPDLRFTYFSERYFDLFGVQPESVYGLSPKDTLGKPAGNSIADNSDERVKQHLDNLENHRPFRNFEYVAARPGSGSMHISVSGTPVFDKSGEFAGYRGTAANISERKRVENRIRATLRQQEVINAVLNLSMEDAPLDRKLERALELIQSAEQLSVEPKGGVFLFDEKAGQLMLQAHRNLPEAIVRKCAKVDLGQCLCGRSVLTGQIMHAAHADDRHAVTYEGMDDHGHYVVPILSREKILGTLVLYLPAGHEEDVSEITFLEAIATTLANMIESDRREEEREHLERQLLQSQKMEAIGTLAGGVAHDINNTLVPILGLTELILDDSPEDTDDRENLQIIHDSAQRARSLVDQILSFSRKDAPERTAQDVNGTVAKSLSLLRSTVPASVDIDMSLSEEALVAEIDSTQIQQVILNLTTNAVQSMDSFGTLTISTDEIVVGVEHLSRCPDLLPGPHARITVADTGCGMDDETMSRVFDPFYTTKDVGEGTGLGLSIVHGIVSSHGGGICISSRPGEGTEIQVFIPLSAEAPGAGAAGRALAS